MAKQTKEEVTVSEFVNPYKDGVSYAEFLKAIPSGVSVEDYCKDYLTQEQIDWLVEDLKHLKQK